MKEVSKQMLSHELTCPICLNILRDTVTTIECLHRFCNECINTALRLGKKECPKCRVKCPSRRSLRRDEKYDSLIKSIFPNLGEFQKEEELWIERMNKEQLEDMKKSDPIAADRSIANADRTTTTREETLLLDYQVFLTPLNRDGPQRFLRTTSSCSVEDIILYIEAYMIGTGHRVNCLYINREDRDIRLHSSQTMMEIYDFDQDFLTVFY